MHEREIYGEILIDSMTTMTCQSRSVQVTPGQVSVSASECSAIHVKLVLCGEISEL